MNEVIFNSDIEFQMNLLDIAKREDYSITDIELVKRSDRADLKVVRKFTIDGLRRQKTLYIKYIY